VVLQPRPATMLRSSKEPPHEGSFFRVSPWPCCSSGGLPSASSADPVAPEPPVPVEFITDAEIRDFAASMDISFEEARFMMYEGGEALVQFVEQHRGDKTYGDLRVLYDDGLQIQFRATDKASPLYGVLEKAVGRPVERFVGGRSASQMDTDLTAAKASLARWQRSSAGDSLSGQSVFIAPDFEAGRIVVRAPSTLVRRASSERVVPAEVGFIVDDSMRIEATSMAGVGLSSGCTVGYVAKRPANGMRALVTAGHCWDAAGSAGWGTQYASAVSDVCGAVDRQLHPITSGPMYEGFFDRAGGYHHFRAVAGGSYPGQPYFRRGIHTQRDGTVVTQGWFSMFPQFNNPANWDCGGLTEVWIYGFRLNPSGSTAIGGDSGGPVVLAYGGHWYLAGSLTGVKLGDEWAAMASLPSDWLICTETTPC